jgi:hypothetical protein
MSKTAGGLSARTPTLVLLNLPELEMLAAALAESRPRRGRGIDRRRDNLARKIDRIRTRKRKRAMRAARR